jgi:nucleoside-diphosphate-sugar epimerase
MKIFITGGTGFVGQHTVAELQKEKHQLLLLSRQDSKPMRWITLLRGDLSDIARWQKKLAAWKPKAALHLAWEGIPDYGLDMSMKNLSQGVAAIRAMAEAGCKKIIVTGSCWEYGRSSGKIDEAMDPRPANAFSAAKTVMHWLGREAAKLSDAEFIWARIFYVYGPGQKATSLIPHLIEQKRNGILPEVKNPNGGNDFIYISDVAQALHLLLTKKTPNTIYNIGIGHVTGVKEIALAVYGTDVIKRKGGARGFYADIERIKKDVGWKPKIKIEEGIKKMMTK